MNPLAALVSENSRLVRRITRFLSLLLVGFYLSLILFNDDVREDLTLPCFSAGWLFYTLGKQPAAAELSGSQLSGRPNR